MMKKFKFMMILLLGLLLAACGSDDSGESAESDASGEEYEKTTMKLAYNLPSDHHVSVGVEQFAEKVMERSNGQIEIQLFPNGQLLDDKDMNQSILNGSVEIGLNSSTMWASTVPAMGIFDVPYVFDDYGQANDLLKGEFGDKLRGAMEEKGAKVLIFADYGYIQFANNKRELKSPEDFKGLKIRSFGDVPSEVINAYGASPVFMGAGEVYMGLQRGTIDGATSGTTAMLQRSYHEVIDYLTINNYSYLEFVLAMNNDYWNSLPENTQQLIEEAAKETEDWIREQAELEDARTLQELEDYGVQVYVVPEEDLPKWREPVMPVWDIFVENAGELGQELLDLASEE